MSGVLRPSVEDWPLDRLRPSGRNPRCHPGRQVEQIAASVRRFGWTNPILVAPDGEVIAGEARLEAARRLKRREVPVLVLDGLTEDQRSAYRIADNRIPLDAGWDEALLAEVMQQLHAADFELDAIGFTDEELAELLAPALPEPGPEGFGPGVATGPTVTRLGDLWELGAHRLICGDSTSAEVLGRLMADRPAAAVVADLVFTDPPYGMAYDGGRAEADLVFTDPPYGMAFGAGKEAGSTAKGAKVKAHGQILGDDLTEDALVDLVGSALRRAKAHARPGAAFYVCLTWRTWAEFGRALAQAGLRADACIVWDKGSIGLGHQHYRPQHEFILYCKGERWCGGRDESDVWTLTRGNTGQYVHPTQKPVDLVRRAIANSSLPREIVLDVFGGSGTTLIACEATSRAARLVELDPKYCDAIVRRWQAFAGGAARLVETGETFAAAAKRREDQATS